MNELSQIELNQGMNSPDPISADTGELEWIDRQIRMRRRYRYREIMRDRTLEEQALEGTISCGTLKARLRSQACMLRKKMLLCTSCPD